MNSKKTFPYSYSDQNLIKKKFMRITHICATHFLATFNFCRTHDFCDFFFFLLMYDCSSSSSSPFLPSYFHKKWQIIFLSLSCWQFCCFYSFLKISNFDEMYVTLAGSHIYGKKGGMLIQTIHHSSMNHKHIYTEINVSNMSTNKI